MEDKLEWHYRSPSDEQLKAALAETFYDVYDSEADIYTYFLARGIQVLRPGGRLGMILQNKWFKAEYADKLRTYMTKSIQVLEVINFGHAPLFEADTFPCILLLQNPAAPGWKAEENACIGFLDVDRKDLPGIDLYEYGQRKRNAVPLQRLRPAGWELTPKAVELLMEKMRRSGTPLREYIGDRPYRGIVTGDNEAFLIDQEVRDKLVREDPGCQAILRKFLRGTSVRRWHTPWNGEWMIFTRRGTNIDQFPSVKAHLLRVKDRLEPKPLNWNEHAHGPWPGRKEGSYKWFELQDTVDFFQLMDAPKIIYQEIQFHSRFSLESAGLYLNNKAFLLPTQDTSLLAVLNSSLIWWFLERYVGHMKDEAFAMQGFKMEHLPIAPTDGKLGKKIGSLGTQLCALTQLRQKEEERFRAELSEATGKEELGRKLDTYWNLDIEAFSLALAKHGSFAASPLGKSRLLKEFLGSGETIRNIQKQICRLEIEIQEGVFDLYSLTPEEVQLVRETVPPRDPLMLAEQELERLARVEPWQL